MDKVLIVDDDAQLLLILTEALGKYSGKFKIMTVRDGLAAIKALQKEHFSLVVTDIQMPRVNGLVLLAYLAKNFPKTPCIVMTGHGTPGLEKRLARDSLYYMTKPFKLSEMAEAIISHLDQHVMLGGTLTGVSVTGFLRLIEMECITCLCEIKSADGEKGFLFFNGGTLFNAFFEELRGEEAALRLLKMNGATIRYKKPPQKNIKRQIKKDLSALLAEAEGV
jgi:two-component system cell cycle response regulator CpdR